MTWGQFETMLKPSARKVAYEGVLWSVVVSATDLSLKAVSAGILTARPSPAGTSTAPPSFSSTTAPHTAWTSSVGSWARNPS